MIFDIYISEQLCARAREEEIFSSLVKTFLFRKKMITTSFKEKKLQKYKLRQTLHAKKYG